MTSGATFNSLNYWSDILVKWNDFDMKVGHLIERRSGKLLRNSLGDGKNSNKSNTSDNRRRKGGGGGAAPDDPCRADAIHSSGRFNLFSKKKSQFRYFDFWKFCADRAICWVKNELSIFKKFKIYSKFSESWRMKNFMKSWTTVDESSIDKKSNDISAITWP